MNKNIRRSIVIAAGVTGAWALGSAVASADELPSSSLSVSDPTGDTGSTLDGVVTGVQDTASGVTGTAASTVTDTHRTAHAAPKTTAPKTTAPKTTTPKAAHGTAGQVSEKASKVRGAAAIQGAKAARAVQ